MPGKGEEFLRSLPPKLREEVERASTIRSKLHKLFEAGYEPCQELAEALGTTIDNVRKEYSLWRRERAEVRDEESSLRDEVSGLKEALARLAQDVSQLAQAVQRLQSEPRETKVVYYGRVKRARKPSGEEEEYEMLPDDEVNVTVVKRLSDEVGETLKALREEAREFRRDLSFAFNRLFSLIEVEAPKVISPSPASSKLAPPASPDEVRESIRRLIERIEEREGSGG
ncbi:hypothetical protein B6U99_05015 [Candidatus Geothermarchaeota archaeon ex4572_27]|nr:MAG: hypothetical protein B6U99_05015 [Candidatus Geothermarchaeota archaeon ex4572_27]